MTRAALLVLCALIASGCAGSGGDGAAPPPEDDGPVHVHGLGVDPADGSLYIATHTGLWRASAGEMSARRVGDSRQDTMGFTIAGPGRFLGSGHPDLREAIANDLPPLLGLIESADGGRTWLSVSLLGEADFHVLRYAGGRVYGYDASGDRLLSSLDDGRTWRELAKPGAIVDLVVDPDDPERLVAAAAGDPGTGLFESGDGGRTWRRVGPAVGLLAWPARETLYLLDAARTVGASADGGRTFARRGAIGGEPAALLAHEGELYAALHDGTVKRSTDGRATWVVRSAP